MRGRCTAAESRSERHAQFWRLVFFHERVYHGSRVRAAPTTACPAQVSGAGATARNLACGGGWPTRHGQSGWRRRQHPCGVEGARCKARGASIAWARAPETSWYADHCAAEAYAAAVPEDIDAPRDGVAAVGAAAASPGTPAIGEMSQRELTQAFGRAPRQLATNFGMSMELPVDASPGELARAVPQIPQRAIVLADSAMKKGRHALVGPGRLVPDDMAGRPDEEIRLFLGGAFERLLKQMVARIVQRVENFTQPACDWAAAWADGVIRPQHAQALFGDRRTIGAGVGHRCDIMGLPLAVVDCAIDPYMASAVRNELEDLQDQGFVGISQDGHSHSSRSAWLDFGHTGLQKRPIPPALKELCRRLAGIPNALQRVAGAGCQVPKLRVCPQALAQGLGEHGRVSTHLDNTQNGDNYREVTVVMHLDPEWSPQDGGALRVVRSGVDASLQKFPQESRCVDLEPRCGRLVLYRSREVWHAVTTLHRVAPRWTLTFYILSD